MRAVRILLFCIVGLVLGGRGVAVAQSLNELCATGVTLEQFISRPTRATADVTCAENFSFFFHGDGKIVCDGFNVTINGMIRSTRVDWLDCDPPGSFTRGAMSREYFHSDHIITTRYDTNPPPATACDEASEWGTQGRIDPPGAATPKGLAICTSDGAGGYAWTTLLPSTPFENPIQEPFGVKTDNAAAFYVENVAGTRRVIEIDTADAVGKVTINGNLLFLTDNNNDVGQPGSGRPAQAYLGKGMTVGGAGNTGVTEILSDNAAAFAVKTAAGTTTFGVNTVAGQVEFDVVAPPANTLALRNSTNQQTLEVYSTDIDLANRRYTEITHDANGTTLSAKAVGTGGTNQDIKLVPQGTGKIWITGMLRGPGGLNTYLDLGSEVLLRNASTAQAMLFRVEQSAFRFQNQGSSQQASVLISGSNVWEQYDGANPGQYKLYGNRTSSTDYERLTLFADAPNDVMIMRAETAGNGAPNIGVRIDGAGSMGVGIQTAPSTSYGLNVGSGLNVTGGISAGGTAGVTNAACAAPFAVVNGIVTSCS